MENKDISKKSIRKLYSKYAKQMNEWYSSGTITPLASQDVRCAMDLQRRHWENLGLKVEMKLENIQENSRSDIGSISYHDRVFVNHIASQNKILLTKISDSRRVIYDRKEEAGLTVVIQQLKENTQPPPNTPLSCPHCGAPSTLAQLENCCPYCDTKFVMDDLYPKVTNYFVDKDPNSDKKKKKNEFWLFILVGILLGFSIIPLSNGTMSASSAIPSSIFAGSIIGVMLWVMRKFFGVFAMMGKDLQGGGKVIKSLQFRDKIKKLDPEFSSEYFRDRAMSLFRIMAYSEDPSLYTACECRRPAQWETVLDATLRNFGVNSYTFKGNECRVSITLYMDCLMYKNGKVKYKSKKVDMTLRKTITVPTDLGFSVKAVSCPSCGASFDAEQVRKCPFCGNDYDLSKYDWVVTSIRFR